MTRRRVIIYLIIFLAVFLLFFLVVLYPRMHASINEQATVKEVKNTAMGINLEGRLLGDDFSNGDCAPNLDEFFSPDYCTVKEQKLYVGTGDRQTALANATTKFASLGFNPQPGSAARNQHNTDIYDFDETFDSSPDGVAIILFTVEQGKVGRFNKVQTYDTLQKANLKPGEFVYGVDVVQGYTKPE